MFKRLSDFLAAKYQRQDQLSQQLEIARVFDLYRTEAQKFLLDEKEIKMVSLKNQVLTIEVESPALANELRLREQEILDKINKQFKKEIIRRLRYRL